MANKRVAVNTTDLAIGMYVAKLDRPWMETPFVFQGFEIREHSEIEQLREYCETVYVDTDRGKLSEAQVHFLLAANTVASSGSTFHGERVKAEQSATQPVRRRGLLSRLGLGRVFAKSSDAPTAGGEQRATVRAEAPLANEAYDLLVAEDARILERARNEGLVDIESVIAAVTPMIESVNRNPDAIAWSAFSKKTSGEDFSRAAATAVWAVMLGRQLGFEGDALQDLAVGGMLLDVGYSNLSADVLAKPGALTEDQLAHLSRHVIFGVEILNGSRGVSQNVLDMVKCHHERDDGSGYPEKLSGSAIPIFGRIAGIVDCYDAMTTRTSYSTAKAGYDAARELNEMRGKEFPAEVVEQFLRTIGMFPTGSVVELSDGSIGVVLEQSSSNPLLPKVMLLLDKDRQAYDEVRVMDLRKVADQSDGSRDLWIDKGLEHGAHGVDPARYFSK